MTTIVGGMEGPIEGPRPNKGRRSHAPAGERPANDVATGEHILQHGSRRGGLAAAGRHSARVAFLRKAIVVGCGALVALLGLAALFDPFRTLPKDISLGQVGLEGTKITLASPKISGFQQDQRPYAIKASKGLRDLTTPNIVELLDIDAEIGTRDAETVRVLASRAVYDSHGENLLLQGDVRISNTGGYDASMQTASIDFKTGSLVADAPVRVTFDAGSVAAERMTITDRGHKVSFEGRVRSVVDQRGGGDRGPPTRDSRK